MIVEGHGTLYRVALDLEAVQKIVYSLVIMGESDLSFHILTKTFCTPEQAQEIINEVTSQISKGNDE